MPRRLFVVWTNPLFRDSVRLLLDHPEVDLAGTTSDYVAAKEAIMNLKPDTILVEEVEGIVPTNLMEILETNHFNLRLISINLDDNRLRVFHRQQWNIVQAEDLLRLILQ